MKRLLFFLSLVFVCFGLSAQTIAPTEIESFSIASITEAAKLFVSYINWVYVLVFMLATWLINDTADASNVGNWLAWFSKISRSARSLIVGVLLILLFAWAFNLTGRMEVFKMILSLILAMVIYKFGINKIFAWLSARLGFKFE